MRFIWRVYKITKRSVLEFIDDDAMTQAAAVAFYTALSFAPLVLLVVIIGGLLGAESQAKLVEALQEQLGAEPAQAAKDVLDNASQKRSAISISLFISIAVLIFSASGVFAQLQAALNRIWDVEAAPGAGVWGYLRKRLLSIGMIFGVLFILLVSMIVSATLGLLLPEGESPVWEVMWRAIDFVVQLVVHIGLFGLIFKYLPDVKIGWHEVLVGAVVTAVLFAIGKWGIGLYLRTAGVGSSYGAAGSLVVLLVWVYYSAIILFLGAEVTESHAIVAGRTIEPDRHAVRLTGENKSPGRAG